MAKIFRLYIGYPDLRICGTAYNGAVNRLEKQPIVPHCEARRVLEVLGWGLTTDNLVVGCGSSIRRVF